MLPGRELTREELASEVAERLGAPHLTERITSGWGAMLKPAAAGGALCFAESADRTVRFASPHDWLPGEWAHHDPDEAMRTVLLRFLDRYGPATHADVARWWGVDAARGRKLVAAHAEALTQVQVDGLAAWTTPEAADELPDAAPVKGVWLLPGFDPYVTAPLSHRDHVIPPGYVDRVSRTAGWISPVLLVDGLIRGVWSPETTRAGVTITVRPFDAVPARVRRAAEAYAAHYQEFLGGPVSVRWEG